MILGTFAFQDFLLTNLWRHLLAILVGVVKVIKLKVLRNIPFAKASTVTVNTLLVRFATHAFSSKSF